MSYPFRLPAVPLLPWQKQFAGACDERAWSAAAELLANHPFKLDAIVLPNTFSSTLLEFIVEAPPAAIEASLLPNSAQSRTDWRAFMIGQLIRAHLLRARAALESEMFSEVHHHLEAAISLRPRTVEQEAIVTAVLTQVASYVGSAETTLAAARPDLECDPEIESPHPNDFRRGVAEEYHPALLPSLLQTAVESGASTEFLDLGVRMIFRDMHWPSWRALAKVTQGGFALRISGRNILRAENALSTNAKHFLQAFLAGQKFKELPPQPASDDVAF